MKRGRPVGPIRRRSVRCAGKNLRRETGRGPAGSGQSFHPKYARRTKTWRRLLERNCGRAGRFLARPRPGLPTKSRFALRCLDADLPCRGEVALLHRAEKEKVELPHQFEVLANASETGEELSPMT